MSLFDQLVSEALKNQPHLSALRVVVEKELLHHDILRILSDNALLAHLTFIGGTCLRTCYGGVRLSEDLDFTGGANFTKDDLSEMSLVLIESLNEKYNLSVTVSEPIKDKKNVATWKVKVETRPAQRHIPSHRINIDICAVPSYEKQPMLLINPYGVEMGTSGLIIQAQSREEIYTDKLIAFAFRPNRIKHRDLWDIMWLYQQGIKPRLSLIPHKLQDRSCLRKVFLNAFDARIKIITSDQHIKKEFEKEMHRFLPAAQVTQMMKNSQFWDFLVYHLEDASLQMHKLD